MYRQGDLLIVPIIGKRPKKGARVEPKAGNLILAEGESTGHAHAIRAIGATLYTISAIKALLSLQREAELTHEEHDPILLPVGDYVVHRKREYTPEAIRRVSD